MTETPSGHETQQHPASTHVRSGATDFDAFYAGRPPWDIGRPQPALAELVREGALVGRVLDAGCGTGEHALLAADLGLRATGVDVAPSAIRTAEQKARQRGLDVRFVAGDALDLAALGTQFDSVVDSGLFHVLDGDDRNRYVASLADVVVPGGRVHLLCFSEHVPGDAGPRRVTQAEIREAFRDGWDVEEIRATQIDSTVSDVGVPAWLATIRRR